MLHFLPLFRLKILIFLKERGIVKKRNIFDKSQWQCEIKDIRLMEIALYACIASNFKNSQG